MAVICSSDGLLPADALAAAARAEVDRLITPNRPQWTLLGEEAEAGPPAQYQRPLVCRTKGNVIVPVGNAYVATPTETTCTGGDTVTAPAWRLHTITARYQRPRK